ncbi:circularly permuted type 2 ATP-grasp protein [Anaerolineae bacterium CFX7]|nr:circularly permuted type 2 ATP-grasp protein [Anaerolineae bacterium CFX7]
MSLPFNPDEHGLRGVSLDLFLRQIFASLPPETLKQLGQELYDQARRKELVYYRDGKIEVINVIMRPLAMFAEQLNYLHYVSQTLLGALKRMPELYLKDFQVREVVPLGDGEAKWLWDTWGASHNQFHTVFGRLDAVADLSGAFAKDSLAFIEANLVGAGGIHLVPTVEEIIMETVVPMMESVAPDLALKPTADLRDIFIQEMLDHAEIIGRKGRAICFVDPKYAGDGPNEQESLLQYYRARDIEIYHADPEELYLRGGEVFYENHLIDVVYRDYETSELVEMEAEGMNVRPMKQLLRQNQMVSSMAGDFDHKSCFEVLTDPRFAAHFTMDERNVFRRHVQWTRILRAARTTDPVGELVELLEFTRANREILVIKPNRAYGGEDVLIGPSTLPRDWDAAIERAVNEPSAWVVQRLAHIPVYEFPVVTESGEPTVSPFYVVYGFAPTKYGLAVLGRASQKQVVNVAQRGGMLAVLVGQHKHPIHAPKMPESKGAA